MTALPVMLIQAYTGSAINSIYFLSFSMDGQLEFIDTADMSLMNRQEHTKVTDINWDPTGRYVVSSLSFWTEKVQ